MNLKMTLKSNSSVKYSYWSIIAFFGFLSFMMQPTAYTWGEQDMMPFFERVFNSSYLSNDFFTNTTMSKNPRWVYGYFIVFLSCLTALPWYKVLYLVKLLFLILNPLLYFEVLAAILRKYMDENKLNRVMPFVLLGLIMMIFLEEYRYYFSVASWLPYMTALHAHNISISLGFIGILLKEHSGHRLVYLTFFVLSCLVHPAVGLFTLGFYMVCMVPRIRQERKEILILFSSAIITVLLCRVLFATQQTLGTIEFMDIYVKERHPWHYSVVDFFNRKGNWVILFVGMNILFLSPVVYGLVKKRRAIWQMALTGMLSYSGSILAQYIFIDIIPSKFMGYLGVSRFTTFGYWILIIIWCLVLAHFSGKRKIFTPPMRLKNFVFIILNFILLGIVFLDDPFEKRYKRNETYYDFIQSTPKDAIFATYSRPMNTDMRLIGKRGVFAGDEFPFAEQYIREYGERRRLIYGSRHDENEGREFYRKLKPADFMRISKKYQLNYIVIETNFNAEFVNVEPVWENHKYSIYSVENFRF